VVGGFGFEQSTETSLMEQPSEHEELRAEVGRLEIELERYRARAERTSKVFLSATNYAERIRESARCDSDLALRKARTKVERLGLMAGELERTERELVRLHDELARLEALTGEARTRVRAFLAAGLQVLDTEPEAGERDSPTSALPDLPNTLQRQLAPPAVSAPTWLADLDRSER